MFPTITDAVEYCRTQVQENGGTWPNEVFVIGGGEIYKAMMPQTNKIYLTEIHANFEGDTQFPEFSKADFKETARIHRPGPPTFDFVTYQRVSDSWR